MDYYRILEDRGIQNQLRPQCPSASEIWAGQKPLFTPGTVEDPNGYIQFLPFYDTSAFLVSEPLGTIFKQFQKGGRYRPCVLGHIKQRVVRPYFFVMPRLIDGIHQDTRYYKNGDLEELVLSKEKIGTHKVFGIKRVRKILWMVAPEVLEEMLRERIVGYYTEAVKIH